MEDEETGAYQKRRARWEEGYASMLPMSVMHDLGAVTMAEVPCKEARNCWSQINTIGYRPLKSNLGWLERKPWSMDDAKAWGFDYKPLQVLMEDDGEWNCSPKVVVDCTPLYRLLDHTSIHSGEHSTIIETMVKDKNLKSLLRSVKMAFALFLRRQPAADNKFEVMVVDPYGQNRSVAFARIVAFCLAQVHVVAIVNHHAKGTWQKECCGGECPECTNSPMSEAKEAALKRAFAIWLGL